MSGTHKIGIIVGEVNTSEFYFATNEDINRLEYVVIRSRELVSIAGVVQEAEVEIIAQIFQVLADSRALMTDLKMEDAEKIIAAGLADARYFAKVRILGYLNNGNVYQPRRAIKPGNPVHLAPNDLLADFYSYPEEEGLYIGQLITRSDVPVYISIRGFQRHASILAQTGGGKSYLAGVIVEELYRKGATIVIIDPHADYVLLGNPIEREGEADTEDLIENIERMEVFQTPNSTGRYTDADVGRVIQQYSIRFADLHAQDIFNICGVPDRFTRIREAIDSALENLDSALGYNLDDLLDQLAALDTNDARNALRYVRRMRRLNIFGDITTPISDIIHPKHVSVIDLSGIPDYVADYIASRILNEIYEQRRNNDYTFPVFVLIEEAHRFLPSKAGGRGGRYSTDIVKEIAAEGRKFGVFLMLITQRPYKVDQDALSQCNSQMILKMTNAEDQSAIKKSSEKLSEDLLDDLPGLNIGEAIIVGNLTRAPVMVKVRRRNTQEGGADLDLLGMLAAAREHAERGEQREQEEAQQELDDIRDMME